MQEFPQLHHSLHTRVLRPSWWDKSMDQFGPVNSLGWVPGSWASCVFPCLSAPEFQAHGPLCVFPCQSVGYYVSRVSGPLALAVSWLCMSAECQMSLLCQLAISAECQTHEPLVSSIGCQLAICQLTARPMSLLCQLAISAECQTHEHLVSFLACQLAVYMSAECQAHGSLVFFLWLTVGDVSVSWVSFLACQNRRPSRHLVVNKWTNNLQEKIQFIPLRTDGVAISMTVFHRLQTDVEVASESENGFEKVWQRATILLRVL
jgi:hypothetical protein